MNWQVTRRKVQPAQVIVFAKKPRKAPPRPPETQTVIMEEVVTTALDLSSEAAAAENTVTAVAEGTVTVLAPPPAPSPAPARGAGKKSRRTRSSTSVPKVIISKGDTPTEALPDSLEATNDLMTLGHALFEKGKVREAKIIFEGLSLSLPDDAFVQTMLGTVCLALNELPKALGYFEAALALDPGDIAARGYRGELRLHRRRLRPAIEDFEYAIAHGARNDPFVERAHRLLKMAKKPARK